MTLVKYSPRRHSLGFYDDVNAVFNSFWRRPLQWNASGQRSWTPAFDVRETDDQIILDAELPGLRKKDIDVSLHDGVLTVSAERQEREVTKDETVHYAEQRYGRFSRSFTLPTEVEQNKVEAKYDNGVLAITLNKTVPTGAERKQIAIK